MQQQYLIHNGELAAVDSPILKNANRGFRYGDGLFESMRMFNGKLQFPELHADRLRAAMRALKIDGSIHLDEYFLKQKTQELNKKNKLKGNARFRLTVYRDGEGLYTPEENKSGYILEGTAMESNGYELNKKGLIVNVYDEMTKPVNKLSNYKTANALLYVMAGLYKTQHQLDEAFILNQHGFLCESISSNIFVVYGKQVYTPALSEGCVAGVMRNAVMQIAKRNDIPLIEAQISPDILNEAEEVFITNATAGIKWVMGFGRKRYFNEVSKTLSNMLNIGLK